MIMNWISKFIILKSDCFQLWLFYKSDFLLQETYTSYQNSTRLNLEKKQSLPIFLKKYYESLWIGLCIFSMKGYLNSKFKSSLEFRDRSGTYMIPQRLVPALRSSFSLVLPEESTQVHILINLKNIQSWKLLTEMQISYITVSPWFWI